MTPAITDRDAIATEGTPAKAVNPSSVWDANNSTSSSREGSKQDEILTNYSLHKSADSKARPVHIK
jgi:hypothetical protein